MISLSLERFRKPPAELLAADLKHWNPEVRATAARMLGSRLRDDGAVSALAESLEDDCPTVREAAAYSLGKLGPWADDKKQSVAIAALVKAIQHGNHGVREAAILSVKNFGSGAEAALPAITSALTDEHPRVRCAAALSLEVLAMFGRKAPAAVPGLINVTTDEDLFVRAAAISCLGAYGRTAKAAIPALIAALNDRNRGVRHSAAAALSRHGIEPRDFPSTPIREPTDADLRAGRVSPIEYLIAETRKVLAHGE